MEINNYIQILVILIHSIVIFIRHREKIDITFKELFTSTVQLVFIMLLIYELGISDLSYKKWYWFGFDLLLAICFIFRIKENKWLNNFKNKKVKWIN